MKTARAIAAASLFLAMTPVWGSHIPPIPDAVTEFQGRVALFLNTRWFDPMLEVQGKIEGAANDFRYRGLTVGSYVRPLPNLKLGVFYRMQAGVRHDDDWIATGDADLPWAWQDTTARIEHELIADVSPRFLLPFLPGKDWVFMLKTRYTLSSYDLEQTLMVRPTLTWFLLVDREPLLSLALAYGLYFRLDTTDLAATVLYQHTPYFEVLWHVAPSVALELTGSWKSVSWRASQDLVDSGEPIPDGTFPLTYRASVIGLGVVVTLAP